MGKRVLVLHSGGMDSTTLLFKAHSEGAEVRSLGIDYGQRLSVEMLFAAQHCERLGISRDIVSLRWQKPERSRPINRSIEEMSESISPAFLPGRNVVFLSIAAAHAAGVGADEVHIGLNSMEFSGYPDCTPEFFDSYCRMMKFANPEGAELKAPLLRMTKREIAQLAASLGLNEFDTWSCYRPQIKDGSVEICGVCDACRLHTHAWKDIE